MTCIVGLEHKGKVYLGGDSAGVSGMSLSIRKDPKVFSLKSFLIGWAGSYRRGQVLQYSFNPPLQAKEKTDMEYLTTTFIDAIRKAYKKAGCLSLEDNQEYAGVFLFGYKNKLYFVDADFQVGHVVKNYQAIGCGKDIALGAMFATEAVAMSPQKRIEMALASAAYFNTGVEAPFLILST